LEDFNDGPLSTGEGQTISQPYIVAYMKEGVISERSLGPVRFVPLIGDEGWEK